MTGPVHRSDSEAVTPSVPRRAAWAKGAVATMALCAIGLTGWLDYVTGPEFGFSILYLVPVGLGAWMLGRWLGIVLAFSAGASWLGVELTGLPAGWTTAAYWNGFARLCIFTAFAVLLSKLRDERAQLKFVNDQLEAQNRDLDAFAGQVAHDLRNALHPIAASPFLLKQSAEGSRRIEEIADRTERSWRKAVAIIDSLLLFARSAGASHVEEGAELRSVLRGVVEELEPMTRGLEASIEWREVPTLQLRCEPGLLHIVLSNVVGNAVKYLEGQPERRVTVTAVKMQGSTVISVEDTGPGIPRHAQERIFEPFYRLEGGGPPGTGLGLATVHRIVYARGGWIALESEEGKGCCFDISLPLIEDLGPAVSRQRRREKRSRAEPDSEPGQPPLRRRPRRGRSRKR